MVKTTESARQKPGHAAPAVAPEMEAAAQTGSYEWRVDGDRLIWSGGLLALYGLQSAPQTESGFSACIHPDDRVRVEAETASLLSSHAVTYSRAFRIVRADGAVRSMLDRGCIERDSQGRALRLRGINIDVSDLVGVPPSEQPDDGAVQTFAELEALYAEAPLGLGLLDRDLKFVRINAALAEINGYSVEAHLSRRVWDLLPDLQTSAEPALRQVLETGLPLRDVRVVGETRAQPGVVREWREHFYPLRGADGQVQGVGVVCEEITERVAAERALAESEAQFRTVADHAPMMVWLTQPDGACTFVSQSWCEFTGQSAEEALGFGWLDAIHSDDAPASERTFRAANESKTAFQMDYRLRRADGVYRWAIGTGRPRFGPHGVFLGQIGSVIDISERKQAEHALRAANETFRQLVERSPFGVYAIDADFRLVQVSDGAQRVFENVRPLLGRDFAEVLRLIWPEPFASEAIMRFRHTLATGEPYRAMRTIEQRADTAVTESYDWKIARLTMPDGRPGVVCHFYDLTERQAHEERVQYLMREVNHRAKNMLSLVDVVAKQTAAAGAEGFSERFSARLRALGASLDLLIQKQWTGADLALLVHSQLMHFKDLIGGRIEVDGPQVRITARAAQTLGMALHELATNAAKYGALSDARGVVSITWAIDGEGAGRTFSMHWRERGGPKVQAPTRRGFGARVVQSVVETALSAKVALVFAETGIVWSLSCPLSQIEAAD